MELPVQVTDMQRRMLYPVSEVAVQLGAISERTVYRLMDSGQLPSIYVLGRRCVEHDALVAYIARQREAARQRAQLAGADPDEGGAGAGPGGGAGTGPRPPYPPTPGKT